MIEEWLKRTIGPQLMWVGIWGLAIVSFLATIVVFIALAMHSSG